MNSRSEDFEKAKNYAFLLLKFRLRSVNELVERLKRKGFTEERSREVVSFLEEKKFVDDKLFAKSWINARLKRPFGLRRIRLELKAKGVDKEVVEEEIGNISEDYTETEIVADLIKVKLKRLKGIEPVVAKGRIYGYLVRRGFSPEIVINNLNRLCKQTS
ncbi:MAG: regulatory protein RecX [Candidatus Omnitrophica bacterium]|nr:regulatory protein RecX [Candidatus Omnitrophota bacterium]